MGNQWKVGFGLFLRCMLLAFKFWLVFNRLLGVKFGDDSGVVYLKVSS